MAVSAATSVSGFAIEFRQKPRGKSQKDRRDLRGFRGVFATGCVGPGRIAAVAYRLDVEPMLAGVAAVVVVGGRDRAAVDAAKRGGMGQLSRPDGLPNSSVRTCVTHILSISI